jgi:hypothetical protein
MIRIKSGSLLFLEKKQPKNSLCGVARSFDPRGINNRATANERHFGFPGGTAFFQKRTF